MSNRHRRGMVLLDLVAALSIGSVVLAMVGFVVYSALRLNQSERLAGLHQQRWQELATTFRRDLHVSTSFAVSAAQKLVLRGRQRITYTFEDDSILRTADQNGEKHFERFRLPQGSRVSFHRHPKTGRLAIVRLSSIHHDREADIIAHVGLLARRPERNAP